MSIAYNSKIIRSGLVLHLDAANPKSYPGTGTTWYDLSGNNKNCTLVNGIEYNSNNSGSLNFDGIDDYAYVNYPSLALLVPSMTVELWIKTSTTENIGIFGSYNLLSPNPIILAINLNRGFGNRDTISPGYTGVYIRDTQNRYLTGYISKNIYNNNWHCFVWNIINSTNNQHEVYVNGQKETLVNTDTSSPSTFTNFEDPVGINSFHGRGIFNKSPQSTFSSIKIYNRSLSAAEIRQNFEAYRDRYGV